jgi:hypothetical protein
MKISNLITCFQWHLIFVAASCGTVDQPSQKEQETVLRSPVEVSVFIDKTCSVSYTDTAVFYKMKDNITSALRLLEEPGDRISFYYLHGKTMAGSCEFIYSIPSFACAKCSKIERLRKKNDHDLKVRQDKAKCVRILQEFMDRKVTEPVSKSTDIFGVLDVVSREFKSTSNKRIYIISDGKHTSGGLQCNPKDLPDAYRLAKDHLGKLSNKYRISKDSLVNSVATMLLPYTSDKTSHNYYLSVYWQEIFLAFGITLKVQ